MSYPTGSEQMASAPNVGLPRARTETLTYETGKSFYTLAVRASELEQVVADIRAKTDPMLANLEVSQGFDLVNSRNETFAIQSVDGSTTYTSYTHELVVHDPTEEEPWFGRVLTVTWDAQYEQDLETGAWYKIGSFPDPDEEVVAVYDARAEVEGAKLTDPRYQLDLSSVTTPVQPGEMTVTYVTKTGKLLDNDNAPTDT